LAFRSHGGGGSVTTPETYVTGLDAVADHLGRGDCVVVGPLQRDVGLVTERAGLVNAIDLNTEAERVELISLLREWFDLVHAAATKDAAALACGVNTDHNHALEKTPTGLAPDGAGFPQTVDAF
jgi:hypothetical protein